MRHLTGLLPDELKQELYALWEVFSISAVCESWMITELISYWSDLQEYETQSSPEARLVKEFDLLEMILQAYEYEELEGAPGRLQEFFDSTNGIALSGRYLWLLQPCPHFFCWYSGRFHHPDVLQLIGSLSEQRGHHMTKADSSEDS